MSPPPHFRSYKALFNVRIKDFGPLLSLCLKLNIDAPLMNEYDQQLVLTPLIRFSHFPHVGAKYCS